MAKMCAYIKSKKAGGTSRLHLPIVQKYKFMKMLRQRNFCFALARDHFRCNICNINNKMNIR